MINAALEETKYEPLEAFVEPYNGAYWIMSIHSKDKKTCMYTDTKKIKNDSFSIAINLRNSKYNNEVPENWEGNDAEREKDGKKIIAFVKENCQIDGADQKLESTIKNQLCIYTFSFKDGEKVDYRTLFKHWLEVLKVFAENIDGIK